MEEKLSALVGKMLRDVKPKRTRLEAAIIIFATLAIGVGLGYFWAAYAYGHIPFQEEKTMNVKVAMLIRGVPVSIRQQLKAKAALEGKSMQGKILELITKYVSGKTLTKEDNQQD